MIDGANLKKLLTEAGLMEAARFDEVLKVAEAAKVRPEVYLVENGLVSDEHLGQLVADFYQVRFVDLAKVAIEQAVLEVLPEAVARRQEMIVFQEDEKAVYVATPNVENELEAALIRKKTGKDVVICYATPTAVKGSLKYYKTEIGDRLRELLALENSEKRATDLVDLLLEYANDSRASDVHIEPLEEEVRVRFRVDGMLHEVLVYPKEVHDNVVSRLKILARLSIDEHAAPQDGRFGFEKGSVKFDVRVSILPVTEGENVVLRLLAENKQRLTLEDLGAEGVDLAKLQAAAKRPYGMILTVGPTGAGKTTSLYAILQILNRPQVNIMTIEDPVEYEIAEVRQTQVNEKKKITFADGLRSIVRQDPDIIMVGEIRDNETAEIAVNSAMTGHLVLSTLHANDAATTFPRLLDMGVEPFLVSSSVNVVIAQRLVRKVCESCRESVFCAELRATLGNQPTVAKMLKQIAGKDDCSKLRVYHGKGCKNCGMTGYKGRMGIFEVLEVNEEIKSLISRRATAAEIETAALAAGMSSMLEDGLRKALAGMTSLEEIVRVVES